jgi:hypothetical protein
MNNFLFSCRQKILYANKTFTHLELDPFAFDDVPYQIKQQFAVDKYVSNKSSVSIVDDRYAE